MPKLSRVHLNIRVPELAIGKSQLERACISADTVYGWRTKYIDDRRQATDLSLITIEAKVL